MILNVIEKRRNYDFGGHEKVFIIKGFLMNSFIYVEYLIKNIYIWHLQMIHLHCFSFSYWTFFMHHYQYLIIIYYSVMFIFHAVWSVLADSFMFKRILLTRELTDSFLQLQINKTLFVFKTWIRTCKNMDVAMVTESSIRVSVFSDDAALFISPCSSTDTWRHRAAAVDDVQRTDR